MDRAAWEATVHRVAKELDMDATNDLVTKLEWEKLSTPHLYMSICK